MHIDLLKHTIVNVCKSVTYGMKKPDKKFFRTYLESVLEYRTTGTLWDGTERCVNATRNGTLATGCIRINNGVLETKMTGAGVANTSWITETSNPWFSSYYTCTNRCGQAGNNQFFTIRLNAHGLYHTPQCGCQAPTTPSFF